MNNELARIDDWAGVLDPVKELSTTISSTEFVPAGLRGSAPKVLAAILYGREIGMPPMTALSQIAVINGRPTLSAEGMRALIMSAGHQIRIAESSADKAVVKGRRSEDHNDPDGWQQFTFTSRDAQLAGLLGKGPWTNYRADMLLARATTRCARAMFADVIHGLASSEEIRDLDDAIQAVQVTDAPTIPAPKQVITQASTNTQPSVEGEAVMQIVEEAAPEKPKRRGHPPATPPARPARTRTPRGQATPEPQPEPEPEQPSEAGQVVQEILDAELVEDEPEPAPDPEPAGEHMDAARRRMFALLGDLNLADRDKYLALASWHTRRNLTTTRDMTGEEVSRFADYLERRITGADQQEAPNGE